MLHPEGPALRALKLLLADSALTVRGGRGKTFWGVGPFFFYENDRSSEVKSRKINAMEGKEAVIDKIWGPIAKKGFLGRNPSLWAQKKSTSSL